MKNAFLLLAAVLLMACGGKVGKTYPVKVDRTLGAPDVETYVAVSNMLRDPDSRYTNEGWHNLIGCSILERGVEVKVLSTLDTLYQVEVLSGEFHGEKVFIPRRAID